MVTRLTPLTRLAISAAALAVGDQAHQEHFAIFGRHFHIRRLNLIAAQQLGTNFGGDPVSDDAVPKPIGWP